MIGVEHAHAVAGSEAERLAGIAHVGASVAFRRVFAKGARLGGGVAILPAGRVDVAQGRTHKETPPWGSSVRREKRARGVWARPRVGTITGRHHQRHGTRPDT